MGTSLDFDYHATVGRQALDHRLALFLVGAGLHRRRLAEAERFDLRSVGALGDEVGAHGVGAALGELLVVLRGAEAIGMAVHDDVADLAEVLELADDFVVECALGFVRERRLVELEKSGGRQVDDRRFLRRRRGSAALADLDVLRCPRHGRRCRRG